MIYFFWLFKQKVMKQQMYKFESEQKNQLIRYKQ